MAVILLLLSSLVVGELKANLPVIKLILPFSASELTLVTSLFVKTVLLILIGYAPGFTSLSGRTENFTISPIG